MMRKALLLLLAAVLCGSLPAQHTEETARLLALFNSHPKADIAVELVKNTRGCMTVPTTRITATDTAGCQTRSCPTA